MAGSALQAEEEQADSWRKAGFTLHLVAHELAEDVVAWRLGAVADLGLDWVSYTPGYRTPALTGTGLCFASFRPGA